MQNILTNIKCSEIIVSNSNENWYIILYDLFSRLCYIATCGPFCKDVTHICNLNYKKKTNNHQIVSCLSVHCVTTITHHIQSIK